MIEIICGTNRSGSRSYEVCQILVEMYKRLGQDCQILELSKMRMEAIETPYSAQGRPETLQEGVRRVNSARGLVVVCPEYNGSYPGILKYFIDHWEYPLSFEARPVCFVGLGGRFGALRPVEHLQGVFGYRNAFIFPERVFITNVWETLKEGQIQDESVRDLIEHQVNDFCRFIQALESQGLDALSRSQSN